MGALPPSKDTKVTKPSFNPIQDKILNMCLVDDDRVCSLYAKELFECVNLADVFRVQIRVKLARLLNLDYDFVRDVVTKGDDKEIIKKNGKKVKITIYRIDNNWKSKVRALLPNDEANRSN